MTKSENLSKLINLTNRLKLMPKSNDLMNAVKMYINKFEGFQGCNCNPKEIINKAEEVINKNTNIL